MVAFEFFGDSNIAKSWKAVASDQERLKGSVLRQTTTKVSLRDNLKTVAQTTKLVLVSALSNPISRLKFEGVELLSQNVTDLLDEIFDFLVQTLNNNAELKVILSIFCIVWGSVEQQSHSLSPHRIAKYCYLPNVCVLLVISRNTSRFWWSLPSIVVSLSGIRPILSSSLPDLPRRLVIVRTAC